MQCRRTITWLSLAFVATGFVVTAGAAPPQNPAKSKNRAKGKVQAKHIDAKAARFFENKVRPILVRHCLSCHGPKQQESGLRLDSRSRMMRGGESGAVIIPGHPDKSRIVDVVRYADDDVQMPPKGKLSAGEIAILKAWIRSGAAWPNSPKVAVASVPDRFNFDELRKEHWAFRSVVRPKIPAVKNSQWPRTAIDRFVLARLKAAGLRPSSLADRQTLIRRVTFDLRGMPPTMAEVDAFLQDSAPDAFARVVDRLLASPQYGERWGRHWLDIARYADTKGYIFNQEIRYAYSYTYRDYVIRAFNEDLPYNQFLMEQIAADQLSGEKRPQALAAMGFLTVGRRPSNNPHDIIDDRIDVVCRGLMGLTVGCARCHDHKYDPIPTADYYSLYGVFASSQEPSILDLPVLGQPTDVAAYQKFLTERAKREQAYRKKLNQGYRELRGQLHSQTASYLLAALNRREINGKKIRLSNQGNLHPRFVLRWRGYLQAAARRHDPIFVLWHQLTALPLRGFAKRARQIIDRYRMNAVAGKSDPVKPQVNRLVLAAFVLHRPNSLVDVAKTYGQLLRESTQPPRTLFKRYRVRGLTDTAKTAKTGRTAQRPDALVQALRAVLSGPNSPTSLIENDIALFNRKIRGEVRALKKRLESLPITLPGAPPRAMVMVDRPHAVNPHIFVRGNAARRGRVVPRQFLGILSGSHRKPFRVGSGRLELAQAIVDPHNPLTARVLVNRVWMHHFGRGLVRTLSNFGVQAEPPTHPKLLDYLAWKFVAGDWSIKRLHREILLSAVYQQQSTPAESHENAVQVDPDNRLLWRMNRRRLEFEARRDSMLFVSGRLDQGMVGRPVNIESRPFTGRRTVYAFVNRNDLPSLFRTFDFPSPDASAPARSETTVPQQTLFEMNAPFVIEQAQLLASTEDIASASGPTEKIRALYRRVLARDPDQTEQAALLQYVRTVQNREQISRPTKNVPLGVWDRIAQALLLTNEFLFVD